MQYNSSSPGNNRYASTIALLQSHAQSRHQRMDRSWLCSDGRNMPTEIMGISRWLLAQHAKCFHHTWCETMQNHQWVVFMPFGVEYHCAGTQTRTVKITGGQSIGTETHTMQVCNFHVMSTGPQQHCETLSPFLLSPKSEFCLVLCRTWRPVNLLHVRPWVPEQLSCWLLIHVFGSVRRAYLWHQDAARLQCPETYHWFLIWHTLIRSFNYNFCAKIFIIIIIPTDEHETACKKLIERGAAAAKRWACPAWFYAADSNSLHFRFTTKAFTFQFSAVS